MQSWVLVITHDVQLPSVAVCSSTRAPSAGVSACHLVPYSRNAIQSTIQLYGAIHHPRLVTPFSRRHTAIQRHTALYEHTAIQHHTLYSPYNTPQTRTTRAGFVSASATASDIDPSRSPWRCARCSCAVAVVDDLVDETRATRPGRRHGCAGSPQAGGSARKRVGGPPEALERRSGINSTRVRAEAFRKLGRLRKEGAPKKKKKSC